MSFKEGTLCFLKPILPETKLIFYSYVTKKNENLTFLAICTQSFKFGEGGLSAQCMQALKNCTSLSFNFRFSTQQNLATTQLLSSSRFEQTDAKENGTFFQRSHRPGKKVRSQHGQRKWNIQERTSWNTLSKSNNLTLRKNCQIKSCDELPPKGWRKKWSHTANVSLIFAKKK